MRPLRAGSAFLPIAALATVAITAACGGSQDQGESGQPAAASASGGAAASAGRVTITSPAEGDTVSGDSITVTMSVEGVKLVPAAPNRVDGEGHLHLFLDVDPTGGDVPIPMAPPAIIHLGNAASTFTFTAVPSGPRRIIAVYAYGDHTIDRRVASDTLNIVVK